MTKRATAATPKRDQATGLWGFVVDLDPGPDGKRRQARRRGFKTRDAAKEALDQLRVDVRDHTYIEPTKLTVQAFLLDEWLPAVKGSLQPSTWASYDRALRLRVVPAIGGIKLRDLDPGHLNRLYADLLENGRNDDKPGGLSSRSVRYTHTILGRALRDAVKWRRLAHSPATAAEPPRASDARPPEMLTWTGAELHQFLNAEAKAKTRYWIAWRLLATTGLRRGEVLGARWGDLDLEQGRLSVRQTITTIDHQVRIAPRTKTGRARVVELDADTIAALRTWRATQSAEKLMLGAGYTDNDLILCHPDGRLYHPDRFSKEFDRRVERHGLRRIRLHDLRHTWATLALTAGVHPKVVQEQLGHSSIAITLDQYSHVSAPMKSDAAEKVAGLILGG